MPRVRCRPARTGGDIRPIRKPETIIALLLVIIATFSVAQLARAQAPTGPTGPTIQVGEPLTERVKPCTVSFKTYNRLVTKYDALTGHHRFKRRNRPVQCMTYRKVKREVKQARSDCKRSALTVTASTFGTSAGDDNGVGYRGDSLFNFNDSFAELSNPGTLDFCALGCLPLHAVRWIHTRIRTVRGVKRDVGKGGGGLAGTKRAIDLHAPLARRLRFGGLGIVRVTRNRCQGAF